MRPRDAAWCHSFALSEAMDAAALASAVCTSGGADHCQGQTPLRGPEEALSSLSLQGPSVPAPATAVCQKSSSSSPGHPKVPGSAGSSGALDAVRAVGQAAASFVDSLGRPAAADEDAGPPRNGAALPQKVGRIAVQSLGAGLESAVIFQPDYERKAADQADRPQTGAAADGAARQLSASGVQGSSWGPSPAPETEPASQPMHSIAKPEGGRMQPGAHVAAGDSTADMSRGGAPAFVPPTGDEEAADRDARAILRAAFSLKAEARSSRCAVMVTAPAGAGWRCAPDALALLKISFGAALRG